MNLGITSKQALVMGASKGLGNAIASALVQEGANVILVARNVERLKAEQQRLQALAPAELRGTQRVDYYVLDLSDFAELPNRLEEIEGRFPSIDILINNCGGPPPKPISSVTSAEWLQYFQQISLSTFTITGHCLPAMRTKGWGRIINLTSSGVLEPIPVLGLSNTLRAAVVAYAKTLATEVAKDGITINSLIPGRIATERLDELDMAAAQIADTDIADIRAQNYHNIPCGRYGTTEEFAAMAVFLASDAASYITGSVHRIDGGLCRSIS